MTTSVAFPFDADRALESHQLHEPSTKSVGGDKLIHTDKHRLHGRSSVPAASQDSALSARTLLHDLFTLILWQSLDRQGAWPTVVTISGVLECSLIISNTYCDLLHCCPLRYVHGEDKTYETPDGGLHRWMNHQPTHQCDKIVKAFPCTELCHEMGSQVRI
jgi:hypothetical protein